MDIKVSLEDYVQQLEEQLVAMNRQLTIQGIQIKKLQEELESRGGNESSNGRSDEENAGFAGRPEQNGAVVSG